MYQKQTWRNGDKATPLSAERLNKMEAGIAEAYNSPKTDLSPLETRVANLENKPESDSSVLESRVSDLEVRPQIVLVGSEKEAESLPLGTIYAVVDLVTEPTISAISSGNKNTTSVDVLLPEAKAGDIVVFALNAKADATTVTPPSGFTAKVDGYWSGTQKSWLYVGEYREGLKFNFSGTLEAAWVAIAISNTSSVRTGQSKGRSDAPADSSTTTTAINANGAEGDLVLGLTYERTTATETPDQVTVSSGWEKVHWQGHGDNIQTILVAKGSANSGDLVVTYPNTQAANSFGVQVVARG